MKEMISGWGRFPKPKAATLVKPDNQSQVETQLARGLGRSYGDAAMGEHLCVMTKLNRILSLDTKKGIITVEAGISIKELLDVIVPLGWFMPVTPGTQFVTIGGAIASDIHGKNHHVDGSFGHHVQSIKLQLADRSIRTLNRVDPLFCATVGGMGLTGTILEATFLLRKIASPFLSVTHTATHTLEELFEALEKKATYSVAWVDSFRLGKAIVMRGEHTELIGKVEKEQSHTVPSALLSPLLKPSTIKAFNHFYHWYNGRKKQFISHYVPFFYPLDALSNWNELYGSKGFIQYQCIVPKHAVCEILKLTQGCSYMVVLKKMGRGSMGDLSFPKEGYTLAIDLVASEKNLALARQLDALVLKEGGRTYLAKDATLDETTFQKMYPKYAHFATIRREVDPQKKFQSNLSRRLNL